MIASIVNRSGTSTRPSHSPLRRGTEIVTPVRCRASNGMATFDELHDNVDGAVTEGDDGRR